MLSNPSMKDSATTLAPKIPTPPCVVEAALRVNPTSRTCLSSRPQLFKPPKLRLSWVIRGINLHQPLTSSLSHLRWFWSLRLRSHGKPPLHRLNRIKYPRRHQSLFSNPPRAPFLRQLLSQSTRQLLLLASSWTRHQLQLPKFLPVSLGLKTNLPRPR